jgi:carbon monoxide dehydrogenase subunit G
MFKKILISIVVVVAVFVALASMQPADFKIARTATVDAPPAKVFAIVNDIHRWNDWSPWFKMDPAMKVTYAGPATGVGASEAWVGNSKVGEGKMTLVASQPNELVTFQLDFVKPMQASNKVDFAFKPAGKGTEVTWTMSGTNNFVGKAFGLIMNMDKMIGGDFEKGLAGLKGLAEAKK